MLYKLQKNFLQGIYDINFENNAFPFIHATKEKSAALQLSIYRSSIFGGLKKALAETYPVTKALVGEEFFNMMLGQYIKEYPCMVQDLNDYGGELADFIKNLKQAKSVPYLADVASLEWFYNIALNAAVQENNLHELSQFSAAQQLHVALALPNGSSLLRSAYPIDDIWKMHEEDTDADVTSSGATSGDMSVGEDVFIIIRKNLSKVHIDKLTAEQFYFLSSIHEGDLFVEVCQTTLNSSADINALFTDSIKRGWIQSYTL